MLIGNRLGGLEIHQVAPNTEIEDLRTGRKAKVTDTSAVHLGWRIYVTPGMYEAILNHPKIVSSPPGRGPDDR
jgi:hypothetical protein